MRFGVKAHWRDVDAMAALARRHGASVLEYQMLLGDLESHSKRALDAFLPYRDEFSLVVHQPEAFRVDGTNHFLDIASPDPDERARGAAALGEAARLAMEMQADALIVHPGGIWRGNVGGGPEQLRDSLEDIPRHVPFLMENMPWFYDMRSFPDVEDGVSPAAFRIPQGLARVDDLVDGYVLDISHAYLAVELGSLEVPRAFVKDLSKRIRHVHASGGRGGIGGAGEGVPFAESDYGAVFVREILGALDENIIVVPEIMDGHLDGGRAFDDAFLWLKGALA